MLRHFAALGLAVTALAGCNPAPPSLSVTDPKTGEKMQVSIDENANTNTISVKSSDGAGTVSVSAAGKAPQNLPAYIPLYPGAVYQGAFASHVTGSGPEGVDAAGGIVSFQTKDPTDKVMAFYKNAFTRAGLKEQASGDMGGMMMLSFSKGDNEQEGAQVMVSPAGADGQIQVQIIYSTAP